MTALLIIAAIILLILILLLLPATMHFDVKAEGNKVRGKIIFKYAFIKIELFPGKAKKTKKKANPEQNTPEKSKKQFSFNEAKTMYKEFSDIFSQCREDIILILKYAGRHSVTFRELDTQIKFDFENPMHTGIATGVINGVVYNSLSFVDNAVGIKKHSVSIQPLFYNSNYFDCHIFGIVRIKNVHIMFILIKALRIYFKINKIKHNKKRKKD